MIDFISIVLIYTKKIVLRNLNVYAQWFSDYNAFLQNSKRILAHCYQYAHLYTQ